MSEIKVEKPVKLLEKLKSKGLNVDLKALFVAGFKGLIRIGFSKWESLAESGVDISAAIGIDSKPGEVAYFLITRSFASAIDTLLLENKHLVTRKPDEKESENILIDRFDAYLENNEIIIDSKFYEYPIDLPIVKQLKDNFADWLKNFIDNNADIENIKNRFPAYFVFALNEQFLSRDYNCLKERLNTPFSGAKERASGWLSYSAWLQKLVEERIFTESFSLKQIYVHLRAYYKVREEKEEKENRRDRLDINDTIKSKKIVVKNLDEKLEEWLEKADSRDAIRFVTGGPGSGKSSFSKMFAAKTAAKGNISVLHIPLHIFDFNNDLIEAVGNFVKFDRYLIENPLDIQNQNLRLFIIFDGLDELSMQGKIGVETARNFVEQVLRKVDSFNHNKTRLQVLITGREVVIEANKNKFNKNKPEQLFYLLPYFVTEADKKEYIDHNNLLAIDQRQTWWQKYGEAKGKDYTKLPSELDRDNLNEITAQPLLNYLVAFAFEDPSNENNDDKGFKFTENTNLNEIYEYLLARVYQRDYERQGNKIIQGIEEQDFITILLEIAICCWQDNSRITTVSEIEKRCDDRGLKNTFDRFKNIFQEDSKASVTRLLAAFYFRQGDRIQGSEQTFEFTHKSFGEYLTAKRIVEEIRYIHEDLEERQKNYRKGCNEEEALIRWATLCGKTAMDEYIFRFVLDEISLIYAEEPELVKNWQKTLCSLIEEIMTNGMPMEGLKNRPNFKEEMRQSRNAEEALLAVLNACARNTREISNINWGSNDAFGTWICRLQGQRIDFEKILVFEFLSFLNLQNFILINRDFEKANLSGADLRQANLRQANLRQANLRQANLRQANLRQANLSGADLSGADLSRADLSRANLSRADLIEANLSEANLSEANLSGADLSRAYLSRAYLSRAYLRLADLSEADLIEANLIGANLSEADLRQVDLIGANLGGADLSRAYLTQADLSRAYLSEADLRLADLRLADLSRADLSGADLRQANLRQADLTNVKWNENTNWENAIVLEKAFNVPEELKKQLRLE